jgi:hypothetical protein
MLKILTSDAFAEWFTALDDKSAEEVATALDVVEQLGPAEAPPESRESLLWYEHPSVSTFSLCDSLAWELEAWGAFRDYAKKVLAVLESPRFVSRLARLGAEEANRVLSTVRAIQRATDPRARWTLKLHVGPLRVSPVRAEEARAEVRRKFFDALDAAGFKVEDVPAHSLALRELSRRVPGPAFRLLYGVDERRELALFVLGERLDHSFYGDSVRRADKMWRQFLEGELRADPAPLR